MLIEPTVTKMDWGQVSQIVEKDLPKGGKIEAGVFRCEPGKRLEMHGHEGADEYCWVFEGKAVFAIAGREYQVGPGEVIFIPRDVEHTSYPVGDEAFSSFFIVCP